MNKEKLELLVTTLLDITCNNFDIDTDEDRTLREAISVIKELEQESCETIKVLEQGSCEDTEKLKLHSLADVQATLDKYDQIRERVLQIVNKIRYEGGLDITDIRDISEVTGTNMWNIKDAYPCRVLEVTYDVGDFGTKHEYIPEDWLFYAEKELEQAVSKEKDRRMHAQILYGQQKILERAQYVADKERLEYERLKKKFERFHEDEER